ncbi:MAG: DUF4271 domain-containing protein [Bacteroidota bacterium]
MNGPGPLFYFLICITMILAMGFGKAGAQSNSVYVSDPGNDTLLLAEPDFLLPLSDSLSEGNRKVFPGQGMFGPHLLQAEKPLIARSRITENSATFISLWILFCMLILSLAKFLFPVRFRETLMAVWDSRFYNQIEREGGLMNNWVSFFLFLNFLFCVSLLFYLTVPHSYFAPATSGIHPLLFLAYGLGGALAFYLVKYILMVFAGWIFNTLKPTGSYMRVILLTNQFMGIALLPVVIIAFYNPYVWILYIAWGVVILLALYKVVRVSLIGWKIPDISAYHLILYLCTIEIAPVLFLVKFSNNLVMN